MSHLVHCSTCFRSETWTAVEDGWKVEEALPGGGRRPSVHAQWARGTTALASVQGGERVVGVCSGCGQLLTTASADVPAMMVRIDTPDGPVVVDEGVVTGPGGPITVDAAEALFVKHFKPSRLEGLAGDLARSSIFLAFTPVMFGWVLATLFVVSFLMAIYQGAPKEHRWIDGTPASQTP